MTPTTLVQVHGPSTASPSETHHAYLLAEQILEEILEEVQEEYSLEATLRPSSPSPSPDSGDCVGRATYHSFTS